MLKWFGLLFISCCIESSKATESAPDIPFPYFNFQKIPSDSGFIVVREISNVISFTMKKRVNGVLQNSIYDLCIVKLLPYQTLNLKNGKELSVPLYIPLMSKIYKNQWNLFTGIDKTTKNIELLSLEDVPLLLKLVIYEMNMYAPKGAHQPYTDLQQIYPDRFQKILSAYLSSQKINIDIYNSIIPISADYKDVKVAARFIFNDIESTQDQMVDVFTSLAGLLPFWISEHDLDAVLACGNISENSLTPIMVSSCYLKFSDKSAPLSDTVNDGFCKFSLQKKIFRDLKDLCLSYYGYIKDKSEQEYIAQTNKKRLDSDYDTLTSIFISDVLYADLMKLIREKRNGQYTESLSFTTLLSFFKRVQQNMKDAKGTSSDVQDGYSTLFDLMEKGESINAEQRQSLQKLLNVMKRDYLSKTQTPAVYDLPDDIFSTFTKDVNASELESIYQEQVLMDKQKKAITLPMSCSKMMFILSHLPVFYKLHSDFLVVSSGFEKYFETLHPDYATSFDDSAQKNVVLKEVSDATTFYNDFKIIVTAVRKLYPGFSFIPKIKETIQHPSLPIDRSDDTSSRIKAPEVVQNSEAPDNALKPDDLQKGPPSTQSTVPQRQRPVVVPPQLSPGKSLISASNRQPKVDATRR